MKNSEKDGDTRPPDLSLEKPVYGSGSNSQNWTWNNNWFQIEKGVLQGCILSPFLFNLYAEYIMRNPGSMKHKLKSRFPGEISITSDTQMTPPFGRKQRGTEESLEESERGK